MSVEDPVRSAKRRAGEEAAARVRDGHVVGLGTGSTAAEMIRALGRRVRDEDLTIAGIPTSFSAAMLARAAGIPLRSLEDVEGIDLAIDGADEVDPHRNLIKGGGAAHTREKVIAEAAVTFLVVVDESKLVSRLGEKTPVPVEVIPMALPFVLRRLRQLGAEPLLRMAERKDGPVVTDEGNLIVDARFGPIEDPASLERAIDRIPGVLESGLFVGMAETVLVGVPGQDEVRQIS
ncbi:MAG: ribose-5-phosphate isomerase RpiA [Candidatus Eisenbacteria bacterium]|nr:ribose-5-phosphate isomerase RpiA [Candidatus Latescibacterota bacterium]MBD3302033.1 ribose-5-phosphate isomerase RpiA [Candidatus Eisenbacteria bacterium]